MTHYRFAVHQDGTRIEELGSMSLPDDREAVEFGNGIARDLNGWQPGLAIAIIKGNRTIRSIPVA
jgi:hypothetical protein